MSLRTLFLAAGLAGAAAAAHAAGVVNVDFVDPLKYTDAGRGALETSRTTRSLEAFLKKLGERLPDGQALQIAVTDIDLAGWTRFNAQGEFRVLRGGADWPRVALRYTLLENGRTMKAGEDNLSDMDYAAHLPRPPSDNDLPYEKRMLEEWFLARFTTLP